MALQVEFRVGGQPESFALVDVEQVRIVQDDHDLAAAFVFFGEILSNQLEVKLGRNVRRTGCAAGSDCSPTWSVSAQSTGRLGVSFLVTILAPVTPYKRKPGNSRMSHASLTSKARLRFPGAVAEDGILVVIDGWKAVSAAVNEVFGSLAAVQCCTLHKRWNVADHVPDREEAWVDAKLVKAFNHPEPDLGLRNAKHLASLLDKTHPGVANGLRGARGDVRRQPPAGRRAARQDARKVHHRRKHDQHCHDDEPERDPLARWPHGAALDRRPDAQRRASVPQDQGYKRMPRPGSPLCTATPPRPDDQDPRNYWSRSVRFNSDRHPRRMGLGTSTRAAPPHQQKPPARGIP